MTAARRPISVASAWAWIRSGVGYHLDNFGRWLIVRAPRLGAAYAGWWTPGAPKPGPRPGWGFAEEYYDQRQWLACRRGALWEAARDNNLEVSLSVPWLAGTTVDVTLGNDNSLCLYVCGSFEPNEFNFLDRLLKPGMVFVDVGANDGYYTLFAARRIGPEGRIVAVEPSSRERGHLERNIARNGVGNVEIVPAALGAAPGHADLHLAHGVHTGHNTLGRFAHDDVVPARVERVPVETLDGVVRRLALPRVDVVKIDVEGGEANVIAGARTVLQSMRPVLMMEVSDGALRAQGSSEAALLETLRRDLRYEILVFSPATGLVHGQTEGMPLSANIIAMPTERLAGIATG
ncbi:MAG: FkbM family methyltransferase [Reyranella sp.]|uniref:FkbM family methyltransferase n=1 Tax=Reyranella sp. TaxID=1929291 RepID=UPI0012251E49|nr:FkbM family methyltransferase [Reyranella sp.]TAJ41542.1 MAG: FkbM family methyltransferase [Reyranella sp.]